MMLNNIAPCVRKGCNKPAKAINEHLIVMRQLTFSVREENKC